MELNPHTTTHVLTALSNGIVVRATRGVYTVLCEGTFLNCILSGDLCQEKDKHGQKYRSSDQPDRLIVGDEVRFAMRSGAGRIVEILPRRSSLSRRSAVAMPGARPAEQLIAANVDLIVPVFAAASPPPRWNLLDRYLVAAEAAGIPALICLTKLDLVRQADKLDPDLHTALTDYERIGYSLVRTCSLSGEGLEELRGSLRGKTSLLLGKSGVGKTSLLNAIEPGLEKRVGALSQANGKGRHTTSLAEMYPLQGGGAVIDTPGVREFGLWEIEAESLSDYFPELRPFVGGCKFGLDCSHDEEPGCAIRQAVLDGLVSPRRYASYLKLREDM